MKTFWLLGLALLCYGCSPVNQLPQQDSKLADTTVESPNVNSQASLEPQPVASQDNGSSDSGNQPPAWMSIGVSDQGNHLDIDTQSIRPTKSFITYRSRILFANPQNGMAIAVNQQVMDCRSGVYQVIEEVTLTNQGKVIEHQTKPLPPEQTAIGSLQEQLHNIVCNEGTVATDSSLDQQMRLETFRLDQQMKLEAFQNQFRAAEQIREGYANSRRDMTELMMKVASQRFGDTPTYPCDYPWERDSMGRLCGERSASERPGGREP